MKLVLLSFFISLNLPCFSQEGSFNLLKKIDSITKKVIGKPYEVRFQIDMIHSKKVFTHTDLANKITLINFWNIGCIPCRKEIPVLNAIHADLQSQENFQLLSVAYDDINDLKNFAKNNHIKYTIGRADKSKIYEMNFHNGFPSTIILDKKGNVAFFHVGLIKYTSANAEDSFRNKPFMDKNIYYELNELLK